MDFDEAMNHVHMPYLLEVVYLDSAKDVLIQNALKKLQKKEDEIMAIIEARDDTFHQLIDTEYAIVD